MEKIKIKINTTIEIKGQVIELTDDELISLRDTLNKLTDYDVPIINIPQTMPEPIPYVYPYDDGIYKHYRDTTNPWMNRETSPSIIFDLEPSSFS